MLNIDCIDHGELTMFWFKHQNGRRYKELFPEGGKGTKRAAADLANYASNLSTSQDCRRRGDIKSALLYENICQKIYDKLPTFARW